jgi:sn-glycerol 3-phosphate transport system permease protein
VRGHGRDLALIATSAAALIWAVPFAWMAVASLRPGVPPDIASLTPSGPFTLGNFKEAWTSGSFPLWYLNTVVMCGGILAVQLVTVSMAGYAFARLSFPGRDWVFSAFLLQLLLIPPLLIVPNLATLVTLHLYDKLLGVMAPYFASALASSSCGRPSARSRAISRRRRCSTAPGSRC